MKKWMKDFLCRHFGHKMIMEVFARNCNHYFEENFPKDNVHYVVVKRFVCERCGKEFEEILSRPMRRSELLKEGWFIQD